MFLGLGACAPPPAAAPPLVAIRAEPMPRAEAPPATPASRDARPVAVTACVDGLPAQLVYPWLLHCPGGAPTVVDLTGAVTDVALPGAGPWALHADTNGPGAASIAGGVWSPNGRVAPRLGDVASAPPAISAGAPSVIAWTDTEAAHWRATDADTTWDAPLRPAGWYPPAVARGMDGPWAVWTAFVGPGAADGEGRLYAAHPSAGGEPVRIGLGGFAHHPVADGRWLGWVDDGDVVVADLQADGGPIATVWPADAGAETAPAIGGGAPCWAERGGTVRCGDGWQTEGTEPTGGGAALLVHRGGQWILWTAR